MSRGRNSGFQNEDFAFDKMLHSNGGEHWFFFSGVEFEKNSNTGTGNIDKFNFYRRAVALN